MSDASANVKLFGTYTFGGGSQLLLGQTYTPSALFYSNSVFDGDGDLLGVGEFYEGRLPMIQWKMGGLKVALIQPTTMVRLAAGKAAVADFLDQGAVDPDLAALIDVIEIDYDAVAMNLELMPTQLAQD